MIYRSIEEGLTPNITHQPFQVFHFEATRALSRHFLPSLGNSQNFLWILVTSIALKCPPSPSCNYARVLLQLIKTLLVIIFLLPQMKSKSLMCAKLIKHGCIISTIDVHWNEFLVTKYSTTHEA